MHCQKHKDSRCFVEEEEEVPTMLVALVLALVLVLVLKALVMLMEVLMVVVVVVVVLKAVYPVIIVFPALALAQALYRLQKGGYCKWGWPILETLLRWIKREGCFWHPPPRPPRHHRHHRPR